MFALPSPRREKALSEIPVREVATRVVTGFGSRGPLSLILLLRAYSSRHTVTATVEIPLQSLPSPAFSVHHIFIKPLLINAHQNFRVLQATFYDVV